MSDERIRVTIVGGYLGAGKTTLVNHVLRSADGRIAVIVNDFGDVGIDAQLIESADGDTIALSNGCICCSMVDGFLVALDTVRAIEPTPERLVIEASGVAIPDQIAAYAHGPGLVPDGIVNVVDAETIRRQWGDEYVGDVVAQQVRAADLIVLNKIDLVDAGDADAAREWLTELADAVVVPAERGRVELDVLLGLEPVDRATDTPSAGPRFETWTETSVEPLDRDELVARLGSLPPEVARVKGIVRFADAPEETAVVQLVGRRLDITGGGRWARERSELVFIAANTSTASEASGSSA